MIAQATFTSAAAGPNSWNVNTSWTQVGVDADGIPDLDDDVIISAGHTITIGVANAVKNLTVNGTLSCTGAGAGSINVYGTNYIVNAGGFQTGTGYFVFRTNGTSISGSGSRSGTTRYTFIGSTTIASGATVTTNTTFTIYPITLTNNGTLKVFNTFTYAGSSFTNGTNANLEITYPGFMAGRTFTATAANNTVTTSYQGVIPTTTGQTYANLVINGTGAGNSLPSTTTVTGNLTINTGRTLACSQNLNIGGNWINNGTINQTAGTTITFNGAVAQTINGTGTSTFKGLAINNNAGVTLSTGTYILDEVLTISNGTFNTGGRPFTMTSDASKTARIAPITGSGAISGNFTIQRFITTRDTTWADLASPVQNSTYGDWANASELNFVTYTYSPPDQYPTQWTYDESADDFSPITSAATALTAGKGYEVFLTGDYSFANFPNKTINTVGVPNQGDQNLNGLVSFANQGTNLVGNPFASSISWSSVFAASSGLSSSYDMYDFPSGNYATFGLGTEIGSGQGFWVYATGAPTLQIPESAKTISSNSSIRSAIIEPFFTLKLSSNDENNNYYHTLKITANNNSSDGWDDNDHPFRKSPNHLAPSINTIIDGKKSVINSFNLSNDSYSMPIQTRVGIAGYYKIEAAGFENLSEYSCIKLEDKLLNKTVDLSPENSYSFQMNVGDNADRFIVHFSKNGDCRSAVANNSSISEFNNNVLILPTTEGNSIEFMFSESTPVNITVTNILGQTVVDALSLNVQSQTTNIVLPQDFSGMYIVKIESSKGVIIKKYVRK